MSEDLNQLCAPGPESRAPAPAVDGSASVTVEAPAEPPQRIKAIRYEHSAMADLIIAHPQISQKELAATFGYSEGWISNILHSDAFQTLLAKRREELIDPAIRARAEAGFDALVTLSQAHLVRKLQAAQVSDQLALRALELSSRARGYGARDPSAPPSGDTVGHLAEMGNNLVQLLRDKRRAVTIDGDAHDHTNDAAA